MDFQRGHLQSRQVRQDIQSDGASGAVARQEMDNVILRVILRWLTAQTFTKRIF